jgi:hypothetical protein
MGRTLGQTRPKRGQADETFSKWTAFQRESVCRPGVQGGRFPRGSKKTQRRKGIHIVEDEPDDIAIFIVFQASRDVGLERGVSLSGGEKVTPASVERVLKEIRERVDGAAAFILDETGEPRRGWNGKMPVKGRTCSITF